MTQGDNPEWTPLVDAVRQEVCGDFMWMFEVELSNGRRLQAYKHYYSRRYVHLDQDGAAFVYEPPERYRSVPLRGLLAAALGATPNFTPLP